MKTYGGMEVFLLEIFLTLVVEAHGPHHSPAILLSEKNTPVASGWNAGWAPELVWVL
jgi:hypothetical protein